MFELSGGGGVERPAILPTYPDDCGVKRSGVLSGKPPATRVVTKTAVTRCILLALKVKLPYSIPSVGPGADPGVQAVSPQVTF